MKQRIFSHFQDYLIQYISQNFIVIVLNIFCLHITVSIIIIIMSFAVYHIAFASSYNMTYSVLGTKFLNISAITL